MSDQPVMVTKFSWDEVFPWTIIFKTLPVAASLTVMILATLGVFATPMGWIASEKVFLSSTMLEEDAWFGELVEQNRSPYRGLLEAGKDKTGSFKVLGVALSGPKLVFQRLTDPFTRIFQGDLGFAKFAYLFAGCAWTLIVWAFFGTAITRVCLLRLCRDEDAGLDDGFEFSISQFGTTLGALMMPLCGVALLILPNFLFGLLLGFDVGTVIGGFFWFVVLAFSFCIGLLLLGLLFGWPLMVASVSCEGQNSLDAMTRSFAYTFQRPLNYLFYSAIAILFGGFCWFIISKLVLAVIGLSFWTTSWGANSMASDRMEYIRGLKSQVQEFEVSGEEVIGGGVQTEPLQGNVNQPRDGRTVPVPSVESSEVPGQVPLSPTEEPPRGLGPNPNAAEPTSASQTNESEPQSPDTGAESGAEADTEETETVTATTEVPLNTRSLEIGKSLINFWIGFAQALAAAFLYGLFWCMASAIYLLLRNDVDDSEMDEIYQVDERRTFELPPLASDEKGIPVVQSPTPVSDSDSDVEGDG